MPYSLRTDRSLLPHTSTWCLGLLLGLTYLTPALADNLQPGQEALRLQQQQQRDLQQLQLEQRQRQMQRGSFSSTPAAPSQPAQTASDERCWPLSGTRIGGVSLFDKAGSMTTSSRMSRRAWGPTRSTSCWRPSLASM